MCANLCIGVCWFAMYVGQTRFQGTFYMWTRNYTKLMYYESLQLWICNVSVQVQVKYKCVWMWNESESEISSASLKMCNEIVYVDVQFEWVCKFERQACKVGEQVCLQFFLWACHSKMKPCQASVQENCVILSAILFL